jgi:hypothetical protein
MPPIWAKSSQRHAAGVEIQGSSTLIRNPCYARRVGFDRCFGVKQGHYGLLQDACRYFSAAASASNSSQKWPGRVKPPRVMYITLNDPERV